MRNKLFELSLIARMLGGGRAMPKMNVSRPKNFKKPLHDYRVPPRSMTAEEKEYYDKHKHLNGLNQISQ